MNKLYTFKVSAKHNGKTYFRDIEVYADSYFYAYRKVESQLPKGVGICVIPDNLKIGGGPECVLTDGEAVDLFGPDMF